MLLLGKKKIGTRQLRSALVLVILVSFLSGSVLTSRQKDAQATICTPCVICFPIDPPIAVLVMALLEEYFWSPLIERSIERHLNYEQNWVVDDFFDDFWSLGVGELTELLSVHGMYQMQMIGSFFDAKNQLETTRLYFKLQAEAHKDYHPSDDFCWFGTNARSLSSSDARAHANVLALSERSLQRQVGYMASTAAKPGGDKQYRWNQFINTYCDPKDNSWTAPGSGLDFACDRDGVGTGVAAGALNIRRVNRDIDYTALLEEPRTLNADFSDVTAPSAIPDDEADILAMAQNLYGNTTPSRALSDTTLKDNPGAQALYMDLRSVIAKRNVAEHSFNAIVALKSAGTNGDPTAPVANRPNVGRYMGAIMRELMPVGSNDADIIAVMGENPSYYAQLEVLSKKIYQSPEFFANLYDKPANVKRKGVAMKAIELMLDRALFESELRQEMLLSVMLSGKLQQKYKNIDYKLKKEDTR